MDMAVMREMEQVNALRDFRAVWERHLTRGAARSTPETSNDPLLDAARQREIEERVRGDMQEFEAGQVVPY
jgi:hypothetical protein